MDYFETTAAIADLRLRDKSSVIPGASLHSAVYPTTTTPIRNTLISFLSYIKTHGIPIVPVSMPDVRTTLGKGASFFVNGAEIPEDYEEPVTGAFIPRGKIVAIKRALLKDDMEDPMADRIKVVFNELITTNHPPLRAHPNIVDLLGVGFEIGGPKESLQATPMLVPEIANMGNLAEVLESAVQEQRPLSFEQKISLCMDILHGLEILHACDIVHGDVKCENMLVFEAAGEPREQADSGSNLCCKLTDFGVHRQGSEGVVLAGSRPWQAPECARSRGAYFRIEDAKRTDIYSFGMLLWRVALDGNPFNILGELEGSTFEDRRESRNQKVNALKEKDELVQHVYQSLASSEFFSRPQLEILCEVVNVTLVKEPKLRELDITRLVRLLSSTQWYEARHPMGPARIPPDDNTNFIDMEKWYHEFASISPVVHNLIVSGLLETAQGSSNENAITEHRLSASYQLAACYANGTGVSFSPKDCLEWLAFAANNGFEQARQAHSKIAEAFALPPLAPTPSSTEPSDPISQGGASHEPSISRVNESRNASQDPSHLEAGLLEAAEGCHYATMVALIAAGVKPGVSKDGVTPLHFASRWEAGEASKLIPQFVQAGVPINAVTKRGPTVGGTPLMWSVHEECIEISQILIDNGADPVQSDDDGESALTFASKIHSVAHLRMLLAHVRPVDVRDQFSKLVQAALGDISRFDRLIRHGKSTKTSADETLGLLRDWASFYSGPGYFKPVLLRALEGSVGSAYANMNTDVQMAAIHAHKVDPSELESMLNESILKFNKVLFNALLDYGVPVTGTFQQQKTLLHSCAKIPDHSVTAAEFAPRILSQGGSIHARDENGLTPWMDAVLERKWDLATLLMNEGSDIHATDNEGFNVLGLCIKAVNAGSMEYLMKYNDRSAVFEKECFLVNEKARISALQLGASLRIPRERGMKFETVFVFIHTLESYGMEPWQRHHRSDGLCPTTLPDASQATALDIAASLGNIHAVKYLVKWGERNDPDRPRAAAHAKAALEKSTAAADSVERLNLEHSIFIIENWDADTEGTRRLAEIWTTMRTIDESDVGLSWDIIARRTDI